MTADKTPIEEAVDQAVDAFVYAPIGLLFDGPARLPTLVRNGRNQVTNARMMGQFAVQMGRTEVSKRAAVLDGPVVHLLRGLGVIDGDARKSGPDGAAAPTADRGPATPPARKEPSAAGQRATTTAAAPRGTEGATSAPSASALPITDYDSLSASQVVSRLQGLSTGELEAVRSYEAATRGRKTILNRVQQLQKP